MTSQFAIPYGYNAERETFPCYTDNRHLCTFGPTRSGKGASIIVQTLLQVPHSVVVIDPKGQNAAITARQRRATGQDVYVLNPFGLHGGLPWNLPKHRYNPLSRLDIHSPNVVADAAALSQALILTQGRDPYFDDTARDLVGTLILYLISTLGKRATLGHMRKMVTDIAARGPKAAGLLTAIGASAYPFISQPIGRFKDADARDISSAINTAITQTAFLDDPALTDPARGGTLTGNDLDLLQLREKPTTVYLILPGRYMDAYARFLRLMITSAIDQLTTDPGGYPVLMLLDEFARLEQLPAVSNAFGFAAGYNLQLWPFLQDLPQLQLLYGKRWTSILANSGLIQFFTPSDVDTAEYLQRRGGFTTGESRSRTYSGGMLKGEHSDTRTESRVPLLPFERMMSLPPDESVTFFAGKHDPLLAGRMPYWRIPRLAGLFDVDPFHMPVSAGARRKAPAA
ncbi:Coupling protein VirD4, ATPase required for T-DNA transfer [Rhodovulum sp. PH10]|uniref:type IV secretory system conjugative DNA transfer family protein n=1 Tax=Rhodovulum sp. PH10 TaxID=1187851 RepID=UPI00027C23C7|nr:type IV secretory system conjugative DNA transfer family protein [Rhodovulum sp. PH10]EJW10838.1 Coupling protein VirD4, ATPase required for T-DNA transfer [Rhodovulum sp. PH10]